jgi:hypothetical protein
LFAGRFVLIVLMSADDNVRAQALHGVGEDAALDVAHTYAKQEQKAEAAWLIFHTAHTFHGGLSGTASYYTSTGMQLVLQASIIGHLLSYFYHIRW